MALRVFKILKDGICAERASSVDLLLPDLEDCYDEGDDD